MKFGMDFYLSDKVEYTFDSLKVGKIYKGGYIIESLSNVRASAVSILEFDGKKLVALSLPEEGNVYVGSGPMTFSKFNYGRVPDKKLYEKEIIRPRSLRLKLAKIERERNIEIQSQSSKP